MTRTYTDILKMIDHTLLKPTASEADVLTLCREAVDYGFCSIITQNYWIPTVCAALEGCQVLVGSVTGFPMGGNTTESKRYECQHNISLGAQEVDTVIALPSVKNGRWDEVYDDLHALADICHGATTRVTLKVILEICLLTDDEKIHCVELCDKAGVDYVKTSTGLAGPGATEYDVGLMRRHASPTMQIKAAGGIRTLKQMMAMVDAGASRIGTSAALAIRQQLLETVIE